MLSTKFCMFYELSETILLFGLRYLHIDLFQFMYMQVPLPSCLILFIHFQRLYFPQFWKTGLHLHSQQTRGLVFLSDNLTVFGLGFLPTKKDRGGGEWPPADLPVSSQWKSLQTDKNL